MNPVCEVVYIVRLLLVKKWPKFSKLTIENSFLSYLIRPKTW